MRLESQVAQNNGPLYPKVDHTSLNVAHKDTPLAFQVLLTAFDCQSTRDCQDVGVRCLDTDAGKMGAPFESP